MKDLRLFLEGKTIEEITVKDVKTKKKVDVVYYCYDKDSLDKVTDQYEHVGKYWIDKYFYLARLNNISTCTIDTDDEWNIHTWLTNGLLLECDENPEE